VAAKEFANVYMNIQTSSFADFLASYDPGLLPGGGVRLSAGPAADDLIAQLPHGTTLVAAVCDHGVVLAGDRRATLGSMISKRDVEKVFRSDEYSAMGIAGTASMGIDFARLF